MRHIELSVLVVFMIAATTTARKAPISVTKPGNCPTFVTPDPPTPCARPKDSCQQDGDCQGIEKCCRRTFCGGYECGPPEPVSKPGQCPKLVIPDPCPLCPIPPPKCNDDYDCPTDEKCCRRRVCEGFECGPPAQVSKPGQCPKLVIPDPRPLCPIPPPKCNDDYDCPKDEKCCRRRVCEGFECGPPAQVSKPGQCPKLVIPDPRPLCPIPPPKCNDDYDCPKDDKCCRRRVCEGFECGPPSQVSKPGQCPKLLIPDPRPLCPIPPPKCNDDYDCPKDDKCCRRRVCEGFECGPPSQVSKPGQCPKLVIPDPRPLCPIPPPKCNDDYDCPKDEKCCRRRVCEGFDCGPPAQAIHKRRPRLCYLRSEVGPCEAMIPRWFYNRRTCKCEKFYYGGCDGNENNFQTAEECVKTCRPKCPRLKCLKFIKCTHGIAIDENGCKTCGCIDPCEGVQCEPYQKCIVQVVQCFMAPCPPIGQCVADPKGPCHVELLALPDPIPIGAFVPQCEDDGYYQPGQCHGSTGQSWCVTREGEEIDGTRTLPGQPITDCSRDK